MILPSLTFMQWENTENFAFNKAQGTALKKTSKAHKIHYVCKITWTYLDIASFEVFQVVFFEIQKAERIRNISLMDKALQIQHMLIQTITEFHITIAKHVRVLPLTVIHK